MWKDNEAIKGLLKKLMKRSYWIQKMDNQYLFKQNEILKNTQFKIEDFFGDNSQQQSISTDHITILNTLLDQMIWIVFLI